MFKKLSLSTILLGTFALQFCNVQVFGCSPRERANSLKLKTNSFLNQTRDLSIGSFILHTLDFLLSMVELEQKTTSQCGGFIPFEDKDDLLYKIPRGLVSVKCIWVLWAKNGGPIRIKNELNPNAFFDPSFKLLVAQNLSHESWNSITLPAGIDIVLETNGPLNTFAVIFFEANVTELASPLKLFSKGVYLKFEDTGVGSATSLRTDFKLLSLSNSNGTLKYPSGTNYENNERVFAIGRVPEGKSLNLKINYVSTEKDHDWFQIMWLDSARSIPMSYRFTGHSGYLEQFAIPQGCSYIIIFFSDGSSTGGGIQMSYGMNENYIL